MSSFVGSIFSALHGLPLIHVERGSRHTAIANPVINLVSRVYDHSIGYWIMRRARQVIGVSGAACEFAQHLGAKATIRIPNGINADGDIVAPTADSILYVGRLIQAKGVQDLIEAHRRLDREIPLIIVGDGPYKRHLQKIAGNDGNIRFLGELSGEYLADAYRSTSIFVNPSYSEGLPTAVMEAAAFGVPVIATDVGGTGEVVQDGATGLLVRPGDVDGMKQAISWMLDHKSEAKQMTEAGRKRTLELYSWDKITSQYCEILESLCRVKQNG